MANLMMALRRITAAALLGIWLFPASAFAAPPAAQMAAAPSPIANVVDVQGRSAGSEAEATSFDQRAEASAGLEAFEGGGAGIYISTTAIVIGLLILIVLILL